MNTKAFMIATAAAGLLLTGAITAHAADEKGGDKVPCLGVNECKGHGGCHTAKNACAGQNGCKGQGVTQLSAAECKAKGGTIRDDSKK